MNVRIRALYKSSFIIIIIIIIIIITIITIIIIFIIRNVRKKADNMITVYYFYTGSPTMALEFVRKYYFILFFE